MNHRHQRDMQPIPTRYACATISLSIRVGGGALGLCSSVDRLGVGAPPREVRVACVEICPAVVKHDVGDVDVVDIHIGQESVVGVAVGGVRVGCHGHGCSVDPACKKPFGFLGTLFVGVAVVANFGCIDAEESNAFVAPVNGGSDGVAIDDVIDGDCGHVGLGGGGRLG